MLKCTILQVLALKHLKILQFFFNLKIICLFFQLFLVFSWNLEGHFFHLFQCGPQDHSLSFMRPVSHSEFETPVSTTKHYIEWSFIILYGKI